MIVRAFFRFLLKTPYSLALAILGVTMGVASITSVHIVSANVSLQLDRLTTFGLTEFTHVLQMAGNAAEGGGAPLDADTFFAMRAAWRNGEYPSIDAMSVVIDENTEVAGRNVRVIGVDVFDGAVFDSLTAETGQVEMGSFDIDSVWIDEELVDGLPYAVNGVLAAGSRVLVCDIGLAQSILDWPPTKLSYIGVKVRDPWASLRALAERLAPGISAGIPESQMHSLTDALAGKWQVISIEAQNPAGQFGRSVLFNVGALGVLAMVVAWLLIYQVAMTWLRRLWPVMQRLYVVGVDWRQLGAVFVLAMLSLGVIASAFGVILGGLLAHGLLSRVLQGAVPQVFDTTVIVKGLASGVIVCVVGAVLAYMHNQRADQIGLRHAGWRILLILVLLGVLLAGIWLPQWGLFGGFGSMAAASVLAAVLLQPALKLLKRRSRWIKGSLLMRLSVREVLWYATELGVAIVGLALALASAIGVGLMVDSFRSDFAAMLDRRLSYDFVVEGDARLLAQAERKLVDTMGDKTARLQRYYSTVVRSGTVPIELVATRMDALEAQRYGIDRALEPSEVLVSEQLSRALDLRVGDALTLFARERRVRGVFSSFGDVQPRALLHTNDAPLGEMVLTELRINGADAIVDALSALPLNVSEQAAMRRSALRAFDRTFSITDVLLALALIVAAIGIYIALNAMRLNRPTSRKILEGLGLSNWEILGVNAARGVGVGAAAVGLALPLGLAFAWILCRVVNPRAFGWTIDLTVSLPPIVTPLGITAAAVLAASVLLPGTREMSVAALRDE